MRSVVINLLPLNFNLFEVGLCFQLVHVLGYDE